MSKTDMAWMIYLPIGIIRVALAMLLGFSVVFVASLFTNISWLGIPATLHIGVAVLGLQAAYVEEWDEVKYVKRFIVGSIALATILMCFGLILKVLYGVSAESNAPIICSGLLLYNSVAFLVYFVMNKVTILLCALLMKTEELLNKRDGDLAHNEMEGD